MLVYHNGSTAQHATTNLISTKISRVSWKLFIYKCFPKNAKFRSFGFCFGLFHCISLSLLFAMHCRMVGKGEFYNEIYKHCLGLLCPNRTLVYRYGTHHPTFFTGTLEEAVQKATDTGRPLLLYLHLECPRGDQFAR